MDYPPNKLEQLHGDDGRSLTELKDLGDARFSFTKTYTVKK